MLIATFARPSLVSAQEGEAAFEVHLSEGGTGIFIKYWPAASKLTVTFDDPATEASPDDEIEVVTGSTDEGYGGEGSIERVVGPGEVVTLTDGTTTKSHTVLDIRVTSFDLDADRVYGTVAVPNSPVTVYATEAGRLVTADAQGRWVADFSVPTDRDPGLVDIVTGTEGSAEQFDEDGDSTVRDWVVQPEGEPAFEVHLSEQGTLAYIKYWPAASKLTVTFDDPATEVSPDDEIEVVTSSTDEGYGGGGWIERLARPGEVVTLTDGTTTKSHTVLDIRVTSFDLDADRVYGTVAVPNSAVTVYTAVGGLRLVTADARGRWVADFSVPTDLEPVLADIVTGTEGGAEQFDEDGDSTVRDWVAPTPTAILGPTPTPVPAFGSISGTVTAGGSPLAGILVDALAQDPGADRWVVVGSATTDPAGEYEIGDVPPDDYRIAFQGGAMYADQYWPDQRYPDTAKTVRVTAGGAPSSIDAGLVSDFRDAGPLVPTITTNIPTPADTSKEPPVVGANLLLAALAMIVFTLATELLNRSLGQLDPTLRRRFRPIDRLDRARARLDAALIGRFGGAGHARRANALRILGIAAFYGIVFALLDPTWNPFSVTGLWLVLVMALAFGVVGLSGDIAAWATARHWGIAGDLAVKPGSLVTAVGSTLFTRVLVLVPGVMIGSPEALEVDAERLDRRRLGGLAGVGLGTVLAIGCVAWLGTLVTTTLRGSGEVVDDLVGGMEAFLLLLFAAAVQNGFVQLLSLRESAGLALRRAYRIPWAIALLAVTFVFWHTLVNPRGDLAEALGSTNVQAFLLTVGIVFAAAVAIWTALAVVRRRGVRGAEVELVTSAAIAPPLEVLVPAQMPLAAAVPGVDPPGPLSRDQPAGSMSPPASTAIAEESPGPPPAAVPAGP